MAHLQNFGEIPDLSGETVEISLKKVRDHLYQLREQLNYVLTHLGTDNLSVSAMEELKTVFTSDIEGRITDDEAHLAALELTAKGLSLSFADGENRLSSLEGAAINEAKKVLAYEVTKQVHGKEEGLTGLVERLAL